MTSIRSKNIYGINPAHQHPHYEGTSALSQHPVSPIHIITTQHTNMPCLKRIEQSTLLSSQTTHHTNNNTQSESSSAGHHMINHRNQPHPDHNQKWSPRRGDSYNYTEAFRALQTEIICSTSHNILGVYFHENLIHENSFILRKFLKTQGAALPVKYRSSNAFLTLKCARFR